MEKHIPIDSYSLKKIIKTEKSGEELVTHRKYTYSFDHPVPELMGLEWIEEITNNSPRKS